MPMLSLADWALVATIASPIATLIGLFGVMWQVRASSQASDQSTATTYYSDLLHKAMDYAQFIAPEKGQVNTTKEEFAGSRTEFRRYEAFVDLMLVAFEESKRRFPKDKAANAYMVRWLREHSTYLDSSYYKKTFPDPVSPELAGLMREASKTR